MVLLKDGSVEITGPPLSGLFFNSVYAMKIKNNSLFGVFLPKFPKSRLILGSTENERTQMDTVVPIGHGLN